MKNILSLTCFAAGIIATTCQSMELFMTLPMRTICQSNTGKKHSMPRKQCIDLAYALFCINNPQKQMCNIYKGLYKGPWMAANLIAKLGEQAQWSPEQIIENTDLMLQNAQQPPKFSEEITYKAPEILAEPIGMVYQLPEILRRICNTGKYHYSCVDIRREVEAAFHKKPSANDWKENITYIAQKERLSPNICSDIIDQTRILLETLRNKN